MLNFSMWQFTLQKYCRLGQVVAEVQLLKILELCVNNFKQWTYFVQALVKFWVFQKLSCLFRLHKFHTLLWNIFYVFWGFDYFYLVFAQDIVKSLWLVWMLSKLFKQLSENWIPQEQVIEKGSLKEQSATCEVTVSSLRKCMF